MIFDQDLHRKQRKIYKLIIIASSLLQLTDVGFDIYFAVLVFTDIYVPFGVIYVVKHITFTFIISTQTLLIFWLLGKNYQGPLAVNVGRGTEKSFNFKKADNLFIGREGERS